MRLCKPAYKRSKKFCISVRSRPYGKAKKSPRAGALSTLMENEHQHRSSFVNALDLHSKRKSNGRPDCEFFDIYFNGQCQYLLDGCCNMCGVTHDVLCAAYCCSHIGIIHGNLEFAQRHLIKPARQIRCESA